VHSSKVAGAVVLTVAVLAFESTPARAEGRYHDGFQFRGAVGFGYLSDAESNDATLGGGAGVLEVYLGGMPVPGLAIGGFLSGAWALGPSVRVNGFRASSSDTSLALATVGPYIDFYPNPRRGLHVLGTLGLARLTASFDNGTVSASDSGTGFTLGGGIGYDWWVGRDWSLGILGRFTFAATSRTFDGVSVSESTFLPAVLFSFTYN
jgi:hypothetical protein